MSQWAHSLIRISGYEVEMLQKRLADISTRRAAAEMRIAVLEAEMEVEKMRAAVNRVHRLAIVRIAGVEAAEGFVGLGEAVEDGVSVFVGERGHGDYPSHSGRGGE